MHIQHNPARLYICDETSITFVQHKHKKYQDWKASVRYPLFNTQIGNLLWQSSPIWVQLDSSFLRYLYFQENVWNKIDEWHTAWINPRVSSLGVDTERDFHSVVSSFHQTYKADKVTSLYLSTGRALFTHKEPGGHYFSSKESCWHHLPLTSQQSQNATLW